MDDLVKTGRRDDRTATLSRVLLYIGIACGVIGLVFLELGRGYSFANEWDFTRFAFTSSNYRPWTLFTDLSQICFLCIIPIVVARKPIRMILVPLFAIGGYVIYSMIEVFGLGTAPLDALFGSASTVVFLIPLFYILATDSDLLETMRRIAPWLALLYLVLTAWSTVNFYMACGWGSQIGWYPAREFYSSAVCYCWFVCLGCFNNGRMSSYSFKITLSALLAVLGFLLLVRSWVIQATLLMLAVTFLQQDGSKRMRRMGHVMMCSIALVVVASSFFPTVFESFAGRFGDDTRSGQYETFFAQVDPASLILGNGYSASYVYGDNPSYRAFDNQLIYTAFHFGIIPSLVYFAVILAVVVSGFRMFSRSPQMRGASLACAFHLAATIGLSTFFSYTVSPGIVFLFALFGVAIYEGARRREKDCRAPEIEDNGCRNRHAVLSNR